MGKLTDYLKCSYSNKALLLGYISTAAGFAYSSVAGPESSALLTKTLLLAGGVGIGMSYAGASTYLSYTRARDYIKQTGNLPRGIPRFIKKQKLGGLLSCTYCNNVGIKLALKEAGLEAKLK